MLIGWSMLLASLLAGEVISRALALPLPGPVLGMALLALLLGMRRALLARVEGAANSLLEIMPMLFVPAGVGVMQHWSELQQAWLPVAITMIFATSLTLAATGLTYRLCRSLTRRATAHDE